MTAPHQARPSPKDGTFWARIQQHHIQSLKFAAIIAAGLMRYTADMAALFVSRAEKRYGA